VKYIKLNFTLSERIFAFFGFVNEKYISSDDTKLKSFLPLTDVKDVSSHNNNIDNIDKTVPKIEIPFFDLGNNKVKSNLD
jgi:hypothetical protein